MGILDDKVAVISASGQGIGREIALLMAREGARVLLNDTDADNGKKASDPVTDRQSAKEMEECPGRIKRVTEDVGMWSGGERLIDAAVDRFGRVDILVHVAGFLPDKAFHEMNPADRDAALSRQLKGAFICTRFAAERMRQQKWGRIIYIISARSLIGCPGQAGAAAANMAAAGLGRNAAIELKRFNVTSNCIAVSGRLERGTAFSATPGAEGYSPESAENQRASGAAPLAAYLAGESAQGISGQIFGTRGAEMYLFSQPRPARSLHCSEGWTPESLAAVLEPAMKNNLEPLDPATDYFSWEPMI